MSTQTPSTGDSKCCQLNAVKYNKARSTILRSILLQTGAKRLQISMPLSVHIHARPYNAATYSLLPDPLPPDLLPWPSAALPWLYNHFHMPSGGLCGCSKPSPVRCETNNMIQHKPGRAKQATAYRVIAAKRHACPYAKGQSMPKGNAIPKRCQRPYRWEILD